jgi:hypothetical protein
MSRRRFLAGMGTAATVTGAAAIIMACESTSLLHGFLISGIEGVQSVQKANNSIPLIAGKRTIVRVYVLASGSNPLPNITGTLDVRRSGTLIAHLTPIVSPTITAPIATAFDRSNPGHSLLFELPPSALSGTISVTASAFVQSQPATVGTRSSTFSFRTLPSQPVQPLLLSQPGTAAPTITQFAQVLQGARTRFPVAENGFAVAAPRVMSIPYTISNDAAWYLLIANLVLPPFLLYGCVFNCPPGGIRAGLLNRPSGSVSQFDGIGFPFPYAALASEAPAGPGNVAGLQTVFAHEMAHAMGALHDHDTCGAGIPWGPSTATTDEPAFDVPMAQLIPRGSTELMSYCNDPRWPSTVTYQLLLNAIPITS